MQKVEKIKSNVYTFSFTGELSWDGLAEYYALLAQLEPPENFVVIVMWRDVKLPDLTDFLAFGEYAKRVSAIIFIPHGILVGLPDTIVLVWKMIAKILPGMVGEIHSADSYELALNMADDLLDG